MPSERAISETLSQGNRLKMSAMGLSVLGSTIDIKAFVPLFVAV